MRLQWHRKVIGLTTQLKLEATLALPDRPDKRLGKDPKRVVERADSDGGAAVMAASGASRSRLR